MMVFLYWQNGKICIRCTIHDFGRPSKVNLLVLINRRFSKELPIQPDYVDERVDSIASESNCRVDTKLMEKIKSYYTGKYLIDGKVNCKSFVGY